METASYQDDDQRAVLTLSIEGAKFSEMGMGRVGEIFGLLAQVAGEDSVLVRYSGGEIIIKEGARAAPLTPIGPPWKKRATTGWRARG